MPAFAIDNGNNITGFAQLPAGADPAQSFASEKELAKLTAEWQASPLADAWNSFAGLAPFDELKLRLANQAALIRYGVPQLTT
jgi:hypothetical protein